MYHIRNAADARDALRVSMLRVRTTGKKNTMYSSVVLKSPGGGGTLMGRKNDFILPL